MSLTSAAPTTGSGAGLAGLRLQLLPGGMVSPSDFQVYATREMTVRACRLILHVIGESSLIMVECGGLRLSELISCAPRQMGLRSLASLELREGETWSTTAARGDGFEYTARLDVSALDTGAIDDPVGASLAHRFPGPGSPVTSIQVHSAPGGLRIQTRHDYPELDATILSESYWRFPGRA